MNGTKRRAEEEISRLYRGGWPKSRSDLCILVIEPLYLLYSRLVGLWGCLGMCGEEKTSCLHGTIQRIAIYFSDFCAKMRGVSSIHVSGPHIGMIVM
jgi:hypothetical protein